MPVGAHCCYKMLGGMEKDLIKDGFEPGINHGEYGLLNSAVSWINLGFPFVVEILLDARSAGLVAVLACLAVTAGQLMFTIGVQSQSFPIALAGRFVFGAGEGAIMVAQGAICSRWFRGAELTFAFGVCEMTHNLANFVGKIAINIGLAFGDWRATNWFGLILCLFGVAVVIIFAVLERRLAASSGTALRGHGTMSCQGFWHLSDLFWMICFLHMLVSNVEHLFDTISTDFVQEKWHKKTTKAAWLSSLNYVLGIGLSPLVGLFLDATSWRMAFAGVACFLMGVAHMLLGLTQLQPAIGLVLLSVPESILPTILRSCVSLVVRPSAVGLAFGVYEVAESLGKTAGAPVVGYVRDATNNYTLDETIMFSASFISAIMCLVISVVDSRREGALNAGKKGRLARVLQLRLQDEAGGMSLVAAAG
eukprot:TRINITY_DN52392_c0_g1_i1.p1 TRINITY_DN52392_c0_g1~~TRINITY_DN52392_c0_g1_i1.p1  ORF type:complete len:470 (-),score=37.92 TRINITY_DN52392_c0_g1_i1:262-1524(-)